MKKIIKKPLFWVIIIAIIVIVVMGIVGFKITYNPNLDNNWNAISACATWVGVIFSGFAIYYAIKVPKTIAKSQNNIALFEKRYMLYKLIYSILDYGKELEELKIENMMEWGDAASARHYLSDYFYKVEFDLINELNLKLNFKVERDNNGKFMGYIVSSPTYNDFDLYNRNFYAHIYEQKKVIEQTSFLFSNDIELLLKKLALTYSKFMCLVCEYSKLKSNDIEKFYECIQFEKDFIPINKMEKNRQDFISVINEMLENKTLEKIENYFRVEEKFSL